LHFGRALTRLQEKSWRHLGRELHQVSALCIAANFDGECPLWVDTVEKDLVIFGEQ